MQDRQAQHLPEPSALQTSGQAQQAQHLPEHPASQTSGQAQQVTDCERDAAGIEGLPLRPRQVADCVCDAVGWSGMPPSLLEYVQGCILPRYDSFDAAHRRDHATSVIERSMALARNYDVRPECVYAVAAYHDTGLVAGRETHHLVSGDIVRQDVRLHEWFSGEEIELMAQACEDHRASGTHPPRSIYGMIVAEADRLIDPRTVIRRTIRYGLSHYPELDREGHWQRTLEHLHAKYADGGYLRLWLPDSPNAAPLEELRAIIRNQPLLRSIFDQEF